MDSPVVHAILVLSVLAATGLALGAIRVKGISLGVAGVMFAGLVLGHYGVQLDDRILDFAREFGLVLFVFTIGMQVGPGFLASLRRQGLALNLLALAVVGLGTAISAALRFATGVPVTALVGLLAGATTNTPSLAAGTQALLEITRGDSALAASARVDPGLGYAVAYPFGILGVIVAMLSVRAFFRIRLEEERGQLDGTLEIATPRLSRCNLEVTNPNLIGLPLARLPLLAQSGIVVSRIYRGGALQVPRPETLLATGDVLLVVGPVQALEDLRVVVGGESALDLSALPGPLTSRRLIVTAPQLPDGRSPRSIRRGVSECKSRA